LLVHRGIFLTFIMIHKIQYVCLFLIGGQTAEPIGTKRGMQIHLDSDCFIESDNSPRTLVLGRMQALRGSGVHLPSASNDVNFRHLRYFIVSLPGQLGGSG